MLHTQPATRMRPAALCLSRNPSEQHIALAWAAAVLRSPSTPPPPSPPPSPPMSPRDEPFKSDTHQVTVDMNSADNGKTLVSDLPALARARDIANLHRSCADYSEYYESTYSLPKLPGAVGHNSSTHKMNQVTAANSIKVQTSTSLKDGSPMNPSLEISSSSVDSINDRCRSQSVPDLFNNDLWTSSIDAIDLALNPFGMNDYQHLASTDNSTNDEIKVRKQSQPASPDPSFPSLSPTPIANTLDEWVPIATTVKTTTTTNHSTTTRHPRHPSSPLAGQIRKRPSGFVLVPQQGPAPLLPLRSPYRLRSSSVTTPAPVCRLLRIVLSARDYVTVRVPVDITLRTLTDLVTSKCLRCGREASDLDYRIFIWERPAPDRTLGVMSDAVLHQALDSLHDVNRPLGSSPRLPEETITLYWT